LREDWWPGVGLLNGRRGIKTTQQEVWERYLPRGLSATCDHKNQSLHVSSEKRKLGKKRKEKTSLWSEKASG